MVIGLDLNQISLFREAFNYNEKTGEFFWSHDRPTSHFKTAGAYKVYQTRFAGKRAGYWNLVDGKYLYLQIRFMGSLVLGHRLAWAITHGEIPNLVDHINGDTTDNSVSNLRNCDSVVNGKNCQLSANNTSGVNGVYWHKDNSNWVAEGHWTEEGRHRKKSLGSYALIDDARKAREVWQHEQDGFTERHGK